MDEGEQLAKRQLINFDCLMVAPALPQEKKSQLTAMFEPPNIIALEQAKNLESRNKLFSPSGMEAPVLHPDETQFFIVVAVQVLPRAKPPE